MALLLLGARDRTQDRRREQMPAYDGPPPLPTPPPASLETLLPAHLRCPSAPSPSPPTHTHGRIWPTCIMHMYYTAHMHPLNNVSTTLFLLFLLFSLLPFHPTQPSRFIPSNNISITRIRRCIKHHFINRAPPPPNSELSSALFLSVFAADEQTISTSQHLVPPPGSIHFTPSFHSSLFGLHRTPPEKAQLNSILR